MAPLRTGGDGFLVRAGASALVSFGTLERRATLRKLLAEAEEGQALGRHGPAPEAPEEVEEQEETALVVSTALERWLALSPAKEQMHSASAASKPVLALGGGWASTTVHALADGPLSFEELREAIAGTPHPGKLRGYLEAMVETGLVEAGAGEDGETRYAVTEWLRQGVAPLVAAARYELRHARESTAPPDKLDVDAAFTLTLPRLTLPADNSGSCRLGVETGGSGLPELTGVTVHLEAGRLTALEPGLDGAADAWASGSSADWLDAVVEPAESRVRLGGEARLGQALIEAVHDVLFPTNPD